MKEASWYFNQNLKPQGPVSFEEIREKIYRGEIGPHDLISNDKVGEWKPANEWGVFERTLFPATQAFIPGQEFQEDEKEWILLVPSADGKANLQEGPFSIREIRQGVQNKNIVGTCYVWKSGLSGWCRLIDRPEFSSLI